MVSCPVIWLKLSRMSESLDYTKKKKRVDYLDAFEK